jgi:predicted DNA-binding protein YlxM (UPF0122 family)
MIVRIYRLKWSIVRENSQKTRPDRLTLADRFEKVVDLFESAIEERLSILQEKDEWQREILLTTDIEDQIAHWQAIQQILKKLKSGK